ncbi:Long-chain base-1-phosphate phosphatase [Coemansia guatemalensis]|uniref:Long-chain base-1-phosphate phosphatase n=1 Tax=Coemansia guatemalensis TaxID=2761395 RepID=A0A9W8I007_9FUNG|nr:Long-chain base-1-phosphate phosphatase [Coemansia guatemalensis]
MPPRFQLDEDEDDLQKSANFVKAPESAYEAVYSPTRLRLRRLVLRVVEWEVPRLAKMQRRWRSPALDRLFVFAGMLGNHTFFMLALPFLHIFGLGVFARGLSFVVLWSFYFSSIVKDYISAPRPASPPVVQITRSPAHTIEYGFPSSHTTYVVSALLYISHYMLNVWAVSGLWLYLLWAVGLVIVFSRVYCGLHSVIDVTGGFVVGALEALAFIFCYEPLDALMCSNAGPLYIIAVLYAALSTMPRSLDLCPCCIDAFCATSVTAGLGLGAWIHVRLPFLHQGDQFNRIAWDTSLTLTQNAMRCVIALALSVVWKLASKPMIISAVRRLFPKDIAAQTPDTTSRTANGQAKGAGNACSSAGHKEQLDKALTPYNIKRGHYGSYTIMASDENLARVPIYIGLPMVVTVVSPVLYYMFGLMPGQHAA